MKVVITGSTGFLGTQLARRLARRKTLKGATGAEAIDEIILFDISMPENAASGLDRRCSLVRGDIADPPTLARVIGSGKVCVFHLGSIVSAGAERDFDLAMRVNFAGTRNVLEACRLAGPQTRLVFASSLAVFGGTAMPETVRDDTKQTPQTTYGMTKAVGELMINDYARKGLVDGRSARLPSVVIRPGRPNAAASGFCSAIFREPLAGDRAVIPVGRDFATPVIGHRAAIAGLIGLMEARTEDLGEDRAFNLPGLTVTVDEMIAAVERAARRIGRPPGPISIEPDARIASIVDTWPAAMNADRALSLGLPASESLDRIIEDYLEDFGAQG